MIDLAEESATQSYRLSIPNPADLMAAWFLLCFTSISEQITFVYFSSELSKEDRPGWASHLFTIVAGESKGRNGIVWNIHDTLGRDQNLQRYQAIRFAACHVED